MDLAVALTTIDALAPEAKSHGIFVAKQQHYIARSVSKIIIRANILSALPRAGASVRLVSVDNVKRVRNQDAPKRRAWGLRALVL